MIIMLKTLSVPIEKNKYVFAERECFVQTRDHIKLILSTPLVKETRVYITLISLYISRQPIVCLYS